VLGEVRACIADLAKAGAVVANNRTLGHDLQIKHKMQNRE
jgi:hypothetical protein